MSSWLCKCFRKKSPAPVDYWDCSRLKLFVLPEEVTRHRKTLTSLDMSVNNFRDVPKEVFSFLGLTDLDLSENDILFLPPAISQLGNLTSLNLGKNSLQNIPDEIQYCQELIFLDLSTNPLGCVNDGITELRQLRTLILNDCQIEELPPNLGKLSKLEVLELRENLLQSLPVSMCHMTLLEKLDLGSNEFHILSTVVGTLESLTELWLDTNMLNTLPDEIGNLRNLRFLEASENHLMALPVTIDGLSLLTDLYLQENLLSMLPDTIGELSKLGIMRLDNNRLTSLPDTIGGLVGLMELTMAHNHLMDLPPTIGQLKKLHTLILDENLLSTLPSEIGGCTLLNVVSLRNNQLIEIPSEFSELLHLSILNVVGNKLPHLPYSLTALKHLTAIWIAENQSWPIIELQLERDQEGERWLTCYLLPQQGHEPPFDQTVDDDTDKKMIHRQRSAVVFDPRVEERKSKITRDPTPYPKELHTKAMQWRASRGDLISNSHDSQHGVEVVLRSPIRRYVHRPYSLLKALSDPLDEEDLLPASRQRSLSASPHGVSPKTRIGSTGPTSPKAEVSLSTGAQNKGHVLYQRDTKSETPNSPPPLLPPVESYPTSPEESIVASYIEPPEEFSANPPHHQNGSLAPAHDQFHDHEHSVPVSAESDQTALLANGNGNNNNSNGVVVMYTTSGGTQAYPRLQSQPAPASYRNRTSTLSCSDHPEVQYSSMESGFDADTELDNSAWYLSPECSPRQHKRIWPNPTVSTRQTQMAYRASSQSRTKSRGETYDHLPVGKARIVGVSSPADVMSHRPTRGQYDSSQSFDAVQSTKCHPKAGIAYQSAPIPIYAQPLKKKTSPTERQSQKENSAHGSSHTRSFSQPEELKNLVSPTRGMTGGSSSSPRNIRGAQATRQHPQPLSLPSYGHRLEREREPRHPSLGQQRAQHVMSDEALLQRVNGYTHPGQLAGEYSGERSRHKSLPPEKISTPHHSDSYYMSDESQTSGGTPTMSKKAAGWMNGNDSGFDSMRRSNYPLSAIAASASGRSSPLSHTGIHIVVELMKAPSFGLCITGGTDGENAIKPGDQGFHVYKIMEGLPAHECGKISVGDKLLEINGKDLSGLTSQDVLALLTGPEKQISLLLFREPSVTLL